MESMEQNDHFIPDGMNDFERSVKRVGDCLLAFIGLIIFSPLFLICYLAVKHEDGGAAIFKQERIGRFGRPFYIYKFRSMKLDAEKYGPALYAGGKDERLTKTGSEDFPLHCRFRIKSFHSYRVLSTRSTFIMFVE